MHAFFTSRTVSLRALVDNRFNNVIGNMMCHPDDMDGINRSCTLSVFKGTLDESEDPEGAIDVSRYAITVMNTKQFELVSHYLAFGISFRQVA